MITRHPAKLRDQDSMLLPLPLAPHLPPSHPPLPQLIFMVVIMLLVMFGRALACDKAQFRCTNGQCIRLDQYCDGVEQCRDRSDESPLCTACNRTYYGEEGVTYSVELRAPRRDALPHLCRLTFIADGGRHGDIVQLVFDAFSVGRFVSHVSNGCPDGHMELIEPQRKPGGGKWCGSGWGNSVYYSEHNTVNVLLKVWQLAADRHFSADETSQFYVKLQYKFLSSQRAVMRSGRKTAKFRGIIVHNSFCDYMFDNCDRDQCSVQSPNFPGIYPRNVTCSYHISHSAVRRGQRAVLVLSQPRMELLNIKHTDSPTVGYPQLRIGSQCDLVHDHVTVYDGVTKSAPKLLRFCGSGPLPPIVSSGNHMIVEFRTSAYDRLGGSHPVSSSGYQLRHPPAPTGFELRIDVRFLNVSFQSGSTSDTNVISTRNCTRTFSSTVQSRGYISSPQHSLPSNITCTYSLLGRSHERLWLAFVEYHVDYHEGLDSSQDKLRHCHHRLDIIDGVPDDVNSQRLGFFCGDNKPRLCPRAWKSYHGHTSPRPCTADESYISTSENVTLHQQHVPGLALDSAKFTLRYEFVDMRQDGEQFGDGACSRIFHSRGRLEKGTFGPSKNVFLYGRGGSRQLRCVFRFQGADFERVRVVINKLSVGDERGCETVYDEQLQRYQCRYHGAARTQLRLAEIPWPGVRVWRDCVCSQASHDQHLTLDSSSSTIELQYEVFNMTAVDDYHSYSFIAMYEFLRRSPCETENRINGSSGSKELKLQSVDPSCLHVPWLLTASAGTGIYLTVQGRRYAPGQCPGHSRLVVSAPDQEKPLAVICPGVAETVEVFGAGWGPSGSTAPNNESAVDHMILELLNARIDEIVHISWLELIRPEITREQVGPVKVFSSFGRVAARESSCQHMCPELEGGCIAGNLWCDGIQHCPSGKDENPEICRLWRVPWLYVCVGCAVLLIIVLLSVATLTRRRQQLNQFQQTPTEQLHRPSGKHMVTDESLVTGTMGSGFSTIKNNKNLLHSSQSALSIGSEDIDLVETTV